jgi:integrase
VGFGARRVNLITARQLAEMLQVHPHTIYRNTTLPRIIVGKSVRFRADDVARYLESRTVKPCPLPPKNDIIILGGKEPMPKRKKYISLGYGAVFIRIMAGGQTRYYLDYKLDGKRNRRVCPHASCLEDAINALKAIVGMRRDQKHITMHALAEMYCTDYSPMKKSKRDDICKKKVLQKFFGFHDIRTITPHDVEKFRQSRLNEGNSRATSNRYLALLRRMLNIAIEEGYLEANPVSRVKLFSEKENLRERILTHNEEAALLSVITLPYLRRAVLLSLYAGLRKGEILRLKWGNINADYTEIKIEHTKSGKYRFVPISARISLELSRWRDGEFVLGREIMDFKRSWHTALVHSGITCCRFHDLRHTFASRLVGAGVDINAVKCILGHSSLLVTERYVHSGKEQLSEAVERLSPVFVPPVSHGDIQKNELPS